MTQNYATLSALVLAASLLGLPAIADSTLPPVQIAQGESELDFWNAIKDSKKAEDYQSYLDKYPNGNFADLAKLRVKKYAPPPAPAAAPAAVPVDPQQADIAYWNSIKSSKNAADYKTYLEKYPNGEFVDLAKLRIDQYSAPAAAPAAAAAPAEQARTARRRRTEGGGADHRPDPGECRARAGRGLRGERRHRLCQERWPGACRAGFQGRAGEQAEDQYRSPCDRPLLRRQVVARRDRGRDWLYACLGGEPAAGRCRCAGPCQEEK